MMASSGASSTRQQRRPRRSAPLGNVAKPPRVAARRAGSSPKLERELAAELPDVDLRDERVGASPGSTPSSSSRRRRAVRARRRAARGRLPALAPRRRRRSRPRWSRSSPRAARSSRYVGGRDWAQSQFDRVRRRGASPAARSSRSCCSPRSRAATGGAPAFTLASLLADEPLEVETPQASWRPANHDEGVPRPDHAARARSRTRLNVPIVRVALALGPEAIVRDRAPLGIGVAARAGAEPRARRGRGLAARAGARLRAARGRRASASRCAPRSTSPTPTAARSTRRRRSPSAPSTRPRSRS